MPSPNNARFLGLKSLPFGTSILASRTRLAMQEHRLIPDCRWAEVAPHSEAPQKYARRVLEFLAQGETNT